MNGSMVAWVRGGRRFAAVWTALPWLRSFYFLLTAAANVSDSSPPRGGPPMLLLRLLALLPLFAFSLANAQGRREAGSASAGPIAVAASGPAGPVSTPLGPEDALRLFSAEVESLIASGGFYGVVLLAQDDQPVLLRAAGEANRDHHVPVQPETVFGVASLGKMFTAVAVAKLVERGLVGWHDPIDKHLRDWLPPEIAARTTIHQLLTHSSGLGDYLEQAQEDPRLQRARTLSDYREFLRSTRLAGVPGEFRYSNTGYLVLGALIEAVTGRDYFAWVHSEVLLPAGMTRTGWWSADEVVENRATGYFRGKAADPTGPRTWRSNLLLQGARGTAAGGALSTAGDLWQFARALVSGRLLPAALVDELLQPRIAFPTGGDYGYGFEVEAGADGAGAFGHAGGFPGVSALLEASRDGSSVLVVLSNGSGGTGILGEAWRGIRSRVGRGISEEAN